MKEQAGSGKSPIQLERGKLTPLFCLRYLGYPRHLRYLGYPRRLPADLTHFGACAILALVNKHSLLLVSKRQTLSFFSP